MKAIWRRKINDYGTLGSLEIFGQICLGQKLNFLKHTFFEVIICFVSLSSINFSLEKVQWSMVLLNIVVFFAN